LSREKLGKEPLFIRYEKNGPERKPERLYVRIVFSLDKD
jgi:hypothetical protein